MRVPCMCVFQFWAGKWLSSCSVTMLVSLCAELRRHLPSGMAGDSKDAVSVKVFIEE